MFDEKMWQRLTNKAKERKTSVGKLVRQAVEKAYVADEELEKRKKALEEILKIRKVSKKRIDYKFLINYGRKY